MKEEIKQYDIRNGNTPFTQKDMLKYLITRVDGIYDKLDKKVDKKIFMWIVGILFTMMIGLTSAAIAWG